MPTNLLSTEQSMVKPTWTATAPNTCNTGQSCLKNKRISKETQTLLNQVVQSIPRENRDYYGVVESIYNDSPALRTEIEGKIAGKTEMPMGKQDAEGIQSFLDAIKGDAPSLLPYACTLANNARQPVGRMRRRKISPGVSPLMPPLPLLLQRQIDSGSIAQAVNYNAPRGSPSALDAIAKLEGVLAGDADTFCAEDVCIVDGGGTNGIFTILKFLGEEYPDGELVLVGPNYFLFQSKRAQQYGLTSRMVCAEEAKSSSSTVRFLPTVNELENALSPATCCLILTQPNNPTGEFYDRQELGDILQLAADRNIRIIDDAAFEELVFTEQESNFPRITSVAREKGLLDRIITIKSFSKGKNFPASRIGYVLTKYAKFKEFQNRDVVIQRDSPSLLNTNVIRLDSAFRIAQLIACSGNNELSNDSIEEGVDTAAKMIPLDGVDVPLTERTARVYCEQSLASRRRYEKLFRTVAANPLFDAVANARSGFNAFVRIAQYPADVRLLDTAINGFLMDGLETQMAPNFGGSEDDWREYGAWMRVTCSTESDYLLDGLDRFSQLMDRVRASRNAFTKTNILF